MQKAKGCQLPKGVARQIVLSSYRLSEWCADPQNFERVSSKTDHSSHVDNIVKRCRVEHTQV